MNLKRSQMANTLTLRVNVPTTLWYLISPIYQPQEINNIYAILPPLCGGYYVTPDLKSPPGRLICQPPTPPPHAASSTLSVIFNYSW